MSSCMAILTLTSFKKSVYFFFFVDSSLCTEIEVYTGITIKKADSYKNSIIDVKLNDQPSEITRTRFPKGHRIQGICTNCGSYFRFCTSSEFKIDYALLQLKQIAMRRAILIAVILEGYFFQKFLSFDSLRSPFE